MTTKPEPKVTVLPYMGKPKEEAERDARRKKFKAPRPVGDGVSRTPARIAQDWRET